MVNTFDRTNLRQIRKDLEEALKSVALAHDITIDLGNIRFSDDHFTSKLEARVKNASLSVTEQIVNAVSGTVIGTKFRVGGTTYEVIGYKPNRPKFPYIGIGPQGGRYKFTRDQVVNGMVA